MLEKQLAGKSRSLIIVPTLLCLVLAAYALLTAQAIGNHPRDGLFDGFARLNPRAASTAHLDNYVLIDIDAESLTHIGPWPWPRTMLARLVEVSQQAGAEGVALTIPVDGPDPLSPDIVAKYWLQPQNTNAPNDTSNGAIDSTHETSEEAASALIKTIAALPTNDVALAAALKEGPAVISIAGQSRDDWAEVVHLVRTRLNQPSTRQQWLTTPSSGEQDISVALSTVKTSGGLNATLAATAQPSIAALPLDKDQKFRRLPPVWNAYDRALPATALAIALMQQPQAMLIPHDSRSSLAGKKLSVLRLGERKFPLDQTNSVRFYPPRQTQLTTIPAWRLLSTGQNWTGALDGKIVIIGQSITSDTKVRTANAVLTKTEIDALMGDQLLSGVAPIRPPWAGFLEAALVILFGVAAIFVALVLRPAIATAIILTTSIVLLVVDWLLFYSSLQLFDLLPAILAVLLVPVSMVVTHFANSIIRDDHLRGAFHGALPTNTMRHIGRPKGTELLQGTRRQVTVLSCAVRLPERAMAQFVDRPNDFIHFVAQSNDKLRRTILDHGGTVDHGEDGRLLGYWNVPEENSHHIERACACALEMIDAMVALSQDVEMSMLASGTRAKVAQEESAFEQGFIEIGITSDVCYAGPVGKGTRNRYSVVGAPVALAGHLRSRSRLYGPAIICDETVYMAMRHHYAFLDLDILRINDDPQISPIYGLVGNPFLKASRAFRELAETQRALIIAWRSGEFDAANAYLAQLKDIPGTNQYYVEMFEKRIAEAKENKIAGRRADDRPWDGSTQTMI